MLAMTALAIAVTILRESATCSVQA